MSALLTGLLLLSAFGQDANAEPREPVNRVHDVPIASIDIPDELAPAIAPFMHCIAASLGIPVRENGRTVPPPSGVSRGSDCSAFRREAQVRGDQILRRLGVQDGEQRRRRVEAALVSADRFAAISANPPPPPPPAEDRANDPGNMK